MDSYWWGLLIINDDKLSNLALSTRSTEKVINLWLMDNSWYASVSCYENYCDWGNSSGWKLYRVWSQHWLTHSDTIVNDIATEVAESVQRKKK